MIINLWLLFIDGIIWLLVMLTVSEDNNFFVWPKKKLSVAQSRVNLALSFNNTSAPIQWGNSMQIISNEKTNIYKSFVVLLIGLRFYWPIAFPSEFYYWRYSSVLGTS